MMETHKTVARRITGFYYPLVGEALDAFAQLLERKVFTKGEVVIAEGQVSRQMVYVERGMIRQFYYKNGRDLTEHFSYEGSMVICLESFLKQEPTRLLAETLETSVVWCIPYEGLHELIRIYPELEIMYRKVMESSLIISQVKADMFRFETAHERYDKLMKYQPEVIKRAPLVHIASYLLMSPETLSRVRAGVL